MGALGQLLNTYAGFGPWEWVEYLFLLFACLVPFDQVRRIWSSQNVDGLSVPMFLVFLAVSIILSVQGVKDHNPSMYFSEIIGIVSNGLLCALILRFKMKPEQAVAGDFETRLQDALKRDGLLACASRELRAEAGR